MRRMRTPALLGIGLAVGMAVSIGCGTFSANRPTPTNPTDGARTDPDPVGPGDDRSMGALKRDLDAYTRKRSGLLSASATDAAVCERLCSLATDICDVQVKLCELADEHPDDTEYMSLCREAKNECHEAQESCVRCVESNK